jgi:hypothetical protein
MEHATASIERALVIIDALVTAAPSSELGRQRR